MTPLDPASLERYRAIGDALADSAVRALKVSPRRGDNVLARVREGAARGDPALSAFVDETRGAPPWVDTAAIERGRRAVMRHAPLTFLVLLVASIVESFAAARGAKVLARTGRLERDPENRLYETASMVRDVLLPGAFDEGASGREALLRVRLLHAYVRTHVDKSGWDRAHLGVPVNQSDMLHTLLLFSHVLVRGLEALGARLSDEEKEGYAALWRYAGWLLGIEPALLPACCDDERRAYALVRQAEYAPDDDSRRLAFAVLRSLANRPPFYLPEEALFALSRRLLGDELADAFALPTSRRWSLAFATLALGYRGLDAGGRRLPGLDGARRGLGRGFVEVNRARILWRTPGADYVFWTAPP